MCVHGAMHINKLQILGLCTTKQQMNLNTYIKKKKLLYLEFKCSFKLGLMTAYSKHVEPKPILHNFS